MKLCMCVSFTIIFNVNSSKNFYRWFCGFLESTPLFYIVWSLITRKRLELEVYVRKETCRLRENEFKSKISRNFLKAMKRYSLPNSKHFWIARDRKWRDRKLTKSLTHGTTICNRYIVKVFKWLTLFFSKLKRKCV